MLAVRTVCATVRSAPARGASPEKLFACRTASSRSVPARCANASEMSDSGKLDELAHVSPGFRRLHRAAPEQNCRDRKHDLATPHCSDPFWFGAGAVSGLGVEVVPCPACSGFAGVAGPDFSGARSP